MNEQMSSVTIEIPTARLAEFHECMARFYGAKETTTAVEPIGSLEPWTPADADLARVVYDKMSSDAQTIYDILLDGEMHTVAELAAHMKRSTHAIAGALSWPAGHAQIVGRVPIHMRAADGSVYVDAATADIFEQARCGQLKRAAAEASGESFVQ
jgi:hypothetical protein